MIDNPDYRPFGAFRFFLAFLVLFKHFSADVAPDAVAALTKPYLFGYVAVLAFFILSGFVITEAVSRFYRARPIRFIENRLLRIVPHYVLALVLMIVVCLVFYDSGSIRIARTAEFAGGEAFGVRNILANMLGFVPLSNKAMDFEFIGIGWAVRVEMMFYLFVALALGLERAGGIERRGRRMLGRILCGLALVLLLPWALSMTGHLPAMLSLAPYFVFGSALYFVLARRTNGAYLVGLVAFAGLTAQFVAYSVNDRAPGTEQGALVEYALLLALIAAIVGLAQLRVGRRVRSADEAFGRVTYPLYVFHPVVEVFVLSFSTGYSYESFVIGLIASVALSCLLQALIDPHVDRIRDAIRGNALAGRAGAAPAASAARA